MQSEYLAGFFDGEGSVSYSTTVSGKVRVNLVVYNTFREVLVVFQKYFNLGTIRATYKGKRHFGKKEVYAWIVNSRRPKLKVLKELYPYLIVRKEQVGEMIKVLEEQILNETKPYTYSILHRIRKCRPYA